MNRWHEPTTALFTRPLPVAAAVLVALNDHVLKGAGLLPPWLTGKLSDVAGLYFAPLLAAEVSLLLWPSADARGRRRRLLGSLVTVGAGFAAMKVFEPASALYLWLLQWQGPVANVVDPTDLVALGSLWLAWATSQSRPSTPT